VRAPALDRLDERLSRVTARIAPFDGFAPRVMVAVAPALVLTWLGFSQAIAVVRNWTFLTANPSWTGASDLTRSALYAAFVLGAAVILVTRKSPRSSDHRRVAIVTSLTATFLMVGLSYLPAGPVLWRASPYAAQCGLVLSVLGATLALASFLSLGSNFSITPESRDLVVTGPYRLIRHPLYLAELSMIVGVVVGYARLTTMVGALLVIGLQVHRIRMEETLLADSFPATFLDYITGTRYRLIPLLW